MRPTKTQSTTELGSNGHYDYNSGGVYFVDAAHTGVDFYQRNHISRFQEDYRRLDMATSRTKTDPLEVLYRRPGFMIRRMQQISVSLFLEETGKLGVTNRQYGILLVCSRMAGH